MQPDIFKLTVDCFDEIFDYLSLQDLCSFGQTCKVIQKMSGEYFKRNYSAAKKYTHNKGIVIVYNDNTRSHRIEAPTFNPFITSITHRDDKVESLRYIDVHSDEFVALSEINFMCIALNDLKIQCLQKILPKIEIIKLTNCSIDGDFYENLLKYCPKLKEIHIEDEKNRPILNEAINPWLLKEYPSLETLHILQSNPCKIHELCTLLTKNSNIRTFSTSSWCLARNGKELIESKVKLNHLKIFEGHNGTRMNMQILCLLLNKLHEQGFYKYLHMKFTLPSQEHFYQMASLYALESLYITILMEVCDLSRLTSLKDLTLPEAIQAETLAKNLVNLRRIKLFNTKFEDIMTFISHSVKLKEIEIYIKKVEKFDLIKLNEQRKKLKNASKVMIFVQESVFLNMKWKTKNGDLNLDFIEIKRYGS